MTKYIIKLVFLTFMFQLITWNGLAQITTTVQQRNFDTCGDALPQAELILGDLVLSETGATNFKAGTYTFFVEAPSNFQITATTTAISGADITSATVAQAAGDNTKLEINVTVVAEASIDQLTLENVRIQLLSGTVTNGTLSYALDGNPNNLNGLTDGQPLAPIVFNALSGGEGVNQQVCKTTDVQNISVTGDTVTQSRTYFWEEQQNGGWTAIPNSNTEILVIDTNTFPNGISRFRRNTTFTVNGETCTLTSTEATVTVNEIDPGTITSGTGQNICATETPQQLSTSGDVAVTVGGTASYQWYQNDAGTWDIINGATNTFYQPGTLSRTTSFKRRITNVFNGVTCDADTEPVTIVVNSVVAGGTTTDQNICTLSELQLLTVNNGENNGTYQWQKDNLGTWEDIPGATQLNFDASSNLTPGVSRYRRITTVSGASCEGVSTVATITYSNFKVGSISGGQTICYNESPSAINSDADATGTGTISYQWQQFNGSTWVAINGATTTAYQPGSLQQNTSFRRLDSIELNGFTCAETTNEITIQVLAEINGGDASANQTICAGEIPNSISIANASAATPNSSYQWQSKTAGNFANMVGETDANLSFASAPGTTTTYRRQTIVSNNAKVCTDFSTESTVFVNAITAGVIGSNQNVCAGETPNSLLSLSNTSAAGTVSYAWESSTDGGSNYSSIAGATGATYTPGVLAATTVFRRLDSSVLNGKTCTTYTNGITITVAGSISGGDGSAAQTVCEGEAPTSLSVTNGTAAGTGIAFQWFSSTDNINYTPIAGETGETLSFSGGISASTYYSREVNQTTGGNTCTAMSTPTLVTLLSLSEGSIGQTQTVCGGASVPPLTSTADAVSNGSITYSWESSLDNATWGTIAGANQATYTPAITDELQTYYRRRATATLQGTTCDVVTQPVIVYVNRFDDAVNHRITFSNGSTAPFEICNQADPAAFDVNFDLIASGNLSYQWQVSNDNVTFSDISGATNALYDAPAVNADIYYRRITTSTLNGVSCDVTSNTLRFIDAGIANGGKIETTNPNTLANTAPDYLSFETVCRGTVPSRMQQLTASSGSTLSYQWFANGTAISGATSIDFTPTAAINSTTRYVRTTYSENINGTTCEVNSNTITVVVPQADFIGDDITLCTGETPPTLGDESLIEDNDNYERTNFDFQWEVSDEGTVFAEISAATSPTYAPNTALTADKYYRRAYFAKVEGVRCGPKRFSNIIHIFVNAVTGGTISEDQQICFGEDPALLNSETEGTARGVLSYQWYSSEDNTTWDIIVGAVNSTYDPQAGNFPTRYFKRTAISTFNGVQCTEDSNTITIAVAEEIVPGTLNSDQTICEGDVPVSLTVTGDSNFGDISWYSSVDGIIYKDMEITDTSFSPPALTQTMFYKRRITRTSLNNLTCFSETNVVKVIVNKVEAGDIVGNQSVCEGSQPTALVEVNGATGAGQLSYQWWSSPDDQTYTAVAGATQPNFLPPTTLTTSTYFKRVVTSSLNGVNCTDATAPVLVTVIPYAIIDNDAIISDDITNVSCFGGADGSIVIPNGRITGGNTAQEQINTVTLFGTPELGSTYSIIIDNIVYEHQVTLNGSNLTQTNDEIVQALVQEINQATGNRLSPVNASANANELLLTAKIEGIGFTAFASTDSTNNAGASSVITQENRMANTYEWVKAGDNSFTASTLSISNLTAGVYFLTVYNEFCGITSEPFLITEPDELTLDIADTCNTALTANSTGGIAPFTFTLTRPNGTTTVNTSNNPSITYTGLTGGATYTVSVKGSTCAIAESKSVTLPFGLQFDEASVVAKNVTCFGQNDGSISLNNGAVTVTGGKSPYNFSWTGPDNAVYNTQNINNLAPGVYVLTVTDQIGCSATYTANIASKSELEIRNVQVVNQQLRCAGDTDAEIGIQITSDASSQIQINWFKNGTSFATNSTNLTNLGPGSYEVVVTDINSDPNAPCTARQTIVITAPEVFTATEVVTNGAQCYAANAQRSFTVEVSGGTAPYEYSVDGNTAVMFSTSQVVITGLSNDSHVITVTDANQCAVQTFTLQRSEPITYNGTMSFTIEPCAGDYPFALDENLITGGTPFYDTNNQPYYLFEWRGPNNFSAQDITTFDAASGSYFLTIIDGNNCESQELEFTFTPTYDPITVSKTITPVSCGANDDGAIAITINGGKRPYSIVWEQEQPGTGDNPNPVFTPLAQNTLRLNGLPEGRLRLTITSTIPGCDQTDSSYRYQELITINKAESLRLVDGPYFDASLCSGDPGSITATIFNSQGGDLSFYYEGVLVPGVETSPDTYSIQIADPVANGSLNVVNDFGCGFTAPLSIDVTEPNFSYSSTEFDVTGLLLAKEDVRFLNTSEGDYAYVTWDFGDGSALVTVDPETDGTLTIHNFDFPGVFDITLSVFNDQGCSRDMVQTVQIGSGYEVMFPNVFSPNGDSINDYFQGEFTGVSSFTFQIYDMWGALVFSTAHDFNDLPINWGWDGNYSNGNVYENLSFRYIFVGTTGDNKQITETGEATILR
ncbi:gliding motility-associated C-terminal domain-containing protein [Maribacter sp. X9]|uniref:T9SS type B sorting domain-containing protein n=1 Tax=Maribacter sp. X9 TaxID=3402159 RepID=UPI003AF39BF6